MLVVYDLKKCELPSTFTIFFLFTRDESQDFCSTLIKCGAFDNSTNALPIPFQQQQLIELIRDGRVEEALKFASEQLAERGEEEPLVLEELERTLALLAFEDPSQSPFSDLLSLSHRQKVSYMIIFVKWAFLTATVAELKAEGAEVREFRSMLN